MPKLRATPQELRERAVLKAVARCQVELGLDCDKDVAGLIGVEPHCYGARKRKKFQGTSLEDFSAMARKLCFTAQEVCEIVGIPYAAEGR